ncbi:hypothetical protein POL68_03975 [Stigmatella sp. ncwal1]|uniref:Cytochrome c domain-containing protein n=1 Tax=Stigmatella ashevillensis TaxID=2995309 RepID=A0ABT5D3L1_9BACT|nr:hypothetical protein [Stigmatella ashevillena]MDC0707619.1 hypothetical protein [Stigmatella ashevillena]
MKTGIPSFFKPSRALCLTGLLAALPFTACSSDSEEKPPDPPEEQNVPCADLRTGLEAGVPATLSETGLYQDIASRTLASGVREFTPRYPLWSDSAQKRRFIQLPDGCNIHTGDMDHWVFPVGARLWKEFVVDGKLLETRFIARHGPGAEDFILVAYAWRADGSDADYVRYGVTNAQGTQHTIPAAKDCKTCHSYLPEQVLGFSALQLDHDGAGVTLGQLAAEGRLTTPPTERLTAPGNTLEAAALGYLHVNCGNCHNPQGIEFNDVFDLRLSVKDKTVQDTGAYRTAVNVSVEKFVTPGINLRIAPGHADQSCVHHRMTIRGTVEQMPPTASRVTDPEGVALIKAWIDGMK